MKKTIWLLSILNLYVLQVYSQHNDHHVDGVVKEVTGHQGELRERILPGANVFWAGTNIGTSADEHGKFSLPYPGNDSNLLVASFVGLINDTLQVFHGEKTWNCI